MLMRSVFMHVVAVVAKILGRGAEDVQVTFISSS